MSNIKKYEKSQIEVYSPNKMMIELRKCNTPQLCYTSQTPHLVDLKNEHGSDKILALLEVWIIDLNEYLNVSRKMGPDQIKQTAIFLLDDFYYFKIADINLIFTNAKKGHYGPLYESLDGLKIYQWFETYANQRAEDIFQSGLQEHEKNKFK